MEVEENIEIPPPVDPNAQNLQLEWQGEERMHGGQPSHEGTSSQGGPSAWFLEYFGKLNESMMRIEQRQEQII